MYEELVELLRDREESFDYDGWIDTAILLSRAADAIEELNKKIDFLMNCIYEAEDSLDRGADNDWARVALEKAERGQDND